MAADWAGLNAQNLENHPTNAITFGAVYRIRVRPASAGDAVSGFGIRFVWQVVFGTSHLAGSLPDFQQ
jgi:hypothetical protein